MNCFRIFYFAGHDEVSSIQYQLHNLKLNPYPELKIFPDETPLPSPCLPAGVNLQQPPAVSVEIRNLPSANNSAPFAFNSQQQQQQQQQQQWHSSRHQRPTIEATPDYCRSSEHFQQQQQSSMFIPQQQSYTTTVDRTYPSNTLPLLRSSEQQPPMIDPTANMSLQFMFAMQKSVSQVINAPHFGFEWVKPNYQMDPNGVDDGIMSSVSILGTDDDDDSSATSSPDNTSIIKVEQLTPNDLQDLYQELEEYVSHVDAEDIN